MVPNSRTMRQYVQGPKFSGHVHPSMTIVSVESLEGGRGGVILLHSCLIIEKYKVIQTEKILFI